MAKFSGMIGYAEERETAPGVYEQIITERPALGDVIRNSRKLEKGESVNDDISLSNRISMIADPYAATHFFGIRYISWMGTKWKVSDVEVTPPRLILTVGGVYNG